MMNLEAVKNEIIWQLANAQEPLTEHSISALIGDDGGILVKRVLMLITRQKYPPIKAQRTAGQVVYKFIGRPSDVKAAESKRLGTDSQEIVAPPPIIKSKISKAKAPHKKSSYVRPVKEDSVILPKLNNGAVLDAEVDQAAVIRVAGAIDFSGDTVTPEFMLDDLPGMTASEIEKCLLQLSLDGVLEQKVLKDLGVAWATHAKSQEAFIFANYRSDSVAPSKADPLTDHSEVVTEMPDVEANKSVESGNEVDPKIALLSGLFGIEISENSEMLDRIIEKSEELLRLNREIKMLITKSEIN